jgi:ubiquinone/menaquinone biosynthesis C-methylase UbiE
MAMISFEKIDYSTDEFCKSYDELPLWSAPFGLLLLEHAPLQAGSKILDVGAGTGFLSIELAQRCGASSQVVAVDPWGAALRRLQEKVAYLGLKNVSWIESAIEQAPIAPESFDLAVSNLGVNNFSDAAAAMAACYRALKPGGTLLITTNTRGHMAEFYEAYRSVLAEAGLQDTLQALETHIDHRSTKESLSRSLAAAGFEVGNHFGGSFVMRFADGSAFLRHHFIRLGFLPDWAGICPPGRVAEVFGILERRLNETAAAAGALSLSIPMLCMQGWKPA